MSKTIKPIQFISALIIGGLLVAIFRTGSLDDSLDVDSKALSNIEFPVLKGHESWASLDIQESLLAILPKPKQPDQEELDRLAAEKANKEREQIKAVPVVDKTVKPMFSMLDEDHQIGLIAIVQENTNKFAILQKINFASQQTETIKVQNQGSVSDLTLTINSQTQIELKGTEKNIILNLFKPRNT